MNLRLSRTHSSGYWAGIPDQHRQINRPHSRIRIVAAQLELSRNNGERFLAPGHACVSRAEWLRCYPDTVLPKSPPLVQGRRRVVVAREDQREHDCGWGIYAVLLG